MSKQLKRLWEKYIYNQKKDWDRIAYSYFDSVHPILDMGCGDGRFMSQDPLRIRGLDWNAEAVKRCKANGHNTIEGDVRALPFENGSICSIHCSHVIEHFCPSDAHQILSEINRVLHDGGILVIRSPLLWSEFYSDLTHVRPYNPRAIIDYLTPAWNRTLKQISGDYKVLHLRWRYKELVFKNRYLNAAGNILYRWGFPWSERTGYMLVMQKAQS